MKLNFRPKAAILRTLATVAIAFVTSVANIAMAQNPEKNISVSGVVTDDSGEPLVGVSVKVDNAKIAVTTDLDGKYRIMMPHAGSVTFSYIGCTPQSVKVTATCKRDIVMHSSTTTLDDVVVVGYGSQKKINLTGSVQSVSSDEILKRSVSNGSNALQGIVPGLTAIQSSGQPGADGSSLTIRGLGSLNSSTSPLILIDGVEGDMNRIDLNQVESISVLKDAASASIYGSRASNGVILITTKRGTSGQVKVTFNGYAGFNTPTTLPETVNAVELMTAVDAARVNMNQDPIYTETIKIYQEQGADNYNYYDTNWRDEVIKSSGAIQNYSLNVSGGSDAVRVFASAGYYKQDGLIDNNQFSRTNLRLNSDMNVFKWMKLGLDMSVRQSDALSPSMASSSTLIGYALTFQPIWSGINSDGTYGYGLNGNNPIAIIRAGGTSHSVAPEYIAKANLTITPFKGMTIVGSYSWKRNDSETKTIAKEYETFEGGVSKGIIPSTGSAVSEARSKSILKQFNLLATYENTLAEKHNFKIMGGFQSEELKYSYLYTNRKNFNYDGYWDLVNGDASTATNSSSRYEYAMLSYLFRVNYNYDNRYLLEVNGRYDGTSRFKNDKRWGFFPSVSAGWRVSQESFWEPIRSTVDNFKVRASFGILGNQDISGYYPYSSAVGTSSAYGYFFDDAFSPGVAQTQLANSLITWEKSRQFDAGIDFSLLNSRLSGTFDYYVRHIDDMLQQFPVPIFVGMTSPWENAGSMRNNGWELSLTWNDRIGNVSYYVKGNLSDVRNKVLNLYGKEYVGTTTITKEGEQYGSYYGYVADGFFQSQEEIDNSAVYGEKVNVTPGFIKYKDLNGDGVINGEDRTIIGSPRPRYEYGLTLGFDWNGFDFSAFFQGIGKKDVLYTGAGARALCGNMTIFRHQMDYWSEDNRNATFPILTVDSSGSGSNNLVSSFWVQSGAYCRLKNLVVGYTLPRKLTQKFFVSKLRLYATAQNLLTIKNNFYDGFDPENAISSGSSCYPLNKTYLFGMNIEF